MIDRYGLEKVSGLENDMDSEYDQIDTVSKAMYHLVKQLGCILRI